MTMKFFDIHSHIQFPPYDADREEVIARMKKEEVGTIVVGTEKDSSQKAVALAEVHEDVFASVGLHPNDTARESFNEEFFANFSRRKKWSRWENAGWISSAPKERKRTKRQKEIFERHIDIAVEFNKPLMIHCATHTMI